MSELAKVKRGNPAATRVRAALREMVNGERCLTVVGTVTDTLLAGEEVIRDPVTYDETRLPLTSERIAALKAVLDVQFKLLAKVLPDLKAVELTGADGGPLQVQSVDRMVLATKLLAVMRGAEGVIEGEASHEPEAVDDWLG